MGNLFLPLTHFLVVEKSTTVNIVSYFYGYIYLVYSVDREYKNKTHGSLDQAHMLGNQEERVSQLFLSAERAGPGLAHTGLCY
jgi:hypothetical protein